MRYEQGSFITVPSKEVLRGVHPTAQALYMWLCSYANETGTCYPSRSKLATDVGCSERTIDAMVDVLLEKGLIKAVGRKDGDRQLSNLYTVIIISTPANPAIPPSKSCYTPPAKSAHELNPVLTQSNEVAAKAANPFQVRFNPGGEEQRAPAEKMPPKEKAAYLPLIAWAESERGFKFLSTETGKQLKALQLARMNGLKGSELRERWEEMSSDPFWSEKGFDWMHVVKSFNRKRS